MMPDVAYHPLRMDRTICPAESPSARVLLRQITALALPVMGEHVLHMIVGLVSTYVANHLPHEPAASASAVSTVSYFLWLIGLTTSALGVGATVLIARARGARHASLANSVCGQAIAATAMLGIVVGAVVWAEAGLLVKLAALRGSAPALAEHYLRLVAFSIPLCTVLFVANAALRGAGDTLTPALAMFVVDAVNILLTFTLAWGWFGIPALGFAGIAWGTTVSYVVGGVLQLVVLLLGRGGLRLYVHRLRPHWLTLKRIVRIGIPAGVEGLLVWAAQFAVLRIINAMDPTNRIPTAHGNAIRLEAISYMMGFAVATAATTLVGQSLGARDPRRAARCAWLSFAAGGGLMTVLGAVFIIVCRPLAAWMSSDPVIADLTAWCLWLAGFSQTGFAAAIIFGGALRGAGDTLAVMVLNLFSIIVLRLTAVILVVRVGGGGLIAVWLVLCGELLCRGALLCMRFLQGRWRHIEV